MNKNEITELQDLIGAADYFNDNISDLEHLSNFHLITVFKNKLKDLNLTVIQLKDILNELASVID